MPGLRGRQPRAARALHGRGVPRPSGTGLLPGPLLAVGPYDYYTARLVPGVGGNSEARGVALWMDGKRGVLYRDAQVY